MIKKMAKKVFRYLFRLVGRFLNPILFYKAKQANTELYADVNSINKKVYDSHREKLLEFCHARNYSEEYSQNWTTHVDRLILTMNALSEITKDSCDDLCCIETGSPSVFTDFLDLKFGEFQWENTTTDLRKRWEFPDEFADLILSTEVVEHLSDIPEGFQDTFYKSGLLAFLKESYRVLKKNGVLFITTPNAASIIHLSNTLRGAAPWFYPLHVREYTISELTQAVKEVGFEVDSVSTAHCLTAHQGTNYVDIYKVLYQYQYNVNDRGDDIFLVAHKA